MVLDFYKSLHRSLLGNGRAVVMVVIDHQGSSPGKTGFKMWCSKREMYGSIGGGIMEHKLVEMSRFLLKGPRFEPFIKDQIHDKTALTSQSGMICSGRQRIAFFDVHASDVKLIEDIIHSTQPLTICFSINGITIGEDGTAVYRGVADRSFDQEDNWRFTESTDYAHHIYLIGGGHVSLALSQVLSQLHVKIHVLDHRESLHTMLANPYAHSKQTVDFEQIDQFIPEGEQVYVIILSFGYRTDLIVLRQLLTKRFAYIGMMGSQKKVDIMFETLRAEGFSEIELQRAHAPIGLNINSHSPQEIAISIAAQLIQIKNRGR